MVMRTADKTSLDTSQVQLPGLWKNLSGGFENGAVVKVDGTYHMFTTAWASGVYSHDIVVHFSSPDRYNWTFLEQVAGCHWQNSSDSADGTDVPLWYDPVAPMPYFNSNENRWEMFHIWCIAQRVTWSPNCTCVRRVSKVLGNAGIYGPWVEVDAVLSPEPGSQPWEGTTLDSISASYLASVSLSLSLCLSLFIYAARIPALVEH